MSGNAALISLGRFRVRRWPFAGPLIVPWIMAGLVLASCGDRPGGGSSGGVEQVSRAITALSLTPTVGTAFAHATTGRLDSFGLCTPGTTITPPPNGTPPPGPFGPGLTPPLLDFEGTDGSSSCRCFFSNDETGSIGPDHYVQTTNCSITVYDRTSKIVAGPVPIAGLFTGDGVAPVCFPAISDASGAYDRIANRWVFTRFGHDFSTPNNNWYQCFAVSDTGDPTGTYQTYAFLISTTDVNDYPKLGIWPDAYYVTSLPGHIEAQIGVTVTAFEREQMLMGNPSPRAVQFFVPDPTPATPPPQGAVHSHMLPAFADGPTPPPAGTPEYVVGMQDDDFGFPADRLQVFEFHVDWTNPAASTFTPTTSVVPTPFHSSVCTGTIGPWFSGCLTQPDPSVPPLYSLSFGYMMQRLVYRTFPDHEALLLNFSIAAADDPPNVHSAIRWSELKRQGADWSLAQEGTHAPDANNRWVGTMAMDKDGDIALGYITGGSSLAASLRYTGRSVSEPLGTLEAEQSLVAGKGSISGTNDGGPVGNLGDYATMSIDPKDDCTFWYTNTYVAGDAPNGEFHTRIGTFKFGSCNNPPVARCKDVTVAANGSCQGTVSAANVDNGSSDADGDPLTFSLAPAGPFSLGATPVTLTAADPSGATGSCTATVTVVDNTPPTLMPPPNKTVAICAESAVVAVGQATATDNCAHPVSVSGQVITANGVALTPPIPVVNGQVTLKAGTYTIRWTASDGTNTVTATQTVVVGAGIQAGQSFLVDDRGQVQNAAGGFGTVANSGTGVTRVGQDTRTGAIVSRGPVTIQHRAVVSGDVVSASTVTRDSDATVTGTITQNGTVALPAPPTLPAFPPATLGGFTVNSGTTQSRPPGSYSSVTMLNGGTLILAAGDYFFQSLTINSGSTLRATPTTRIFVRDALVFNAPVRATSGTALQAITLGFAGTSLGLFAPFNGTLIAPNAAVTFGTGAGLTYRGSFFGRTLEITPASVLVCAPS